MAAPHLDVIKNSSNCLKNCDEIARDRDDLHKTFFAVFASRSYWISARRRRMPTAVCFGSGSELPPHADMHHLRQETRACRSFSIRSCKPDKFLYAFGSWGAPVASLVSFKLHTRALIQRLSCSTPFNRTRFWTYQTLREMKSHTL